MHFTFKLLQLISGSLNCRATFWYWNDFNVHVYIYSPVISKYAPTRSYSTELLSVFYPGPIAFNQGQSPRRFTRTTRISGHLAWNDEPVIFFSVGQRHSIFISLLDPLRSYLCPFLYREKKINILTTSLSSNRKQLNGHKYVTNSVVLRTVISLTRVGVILSLRSGVTWLYDQILDGITCSVKWQKKRQNEMKQIRSKFHGTVVVNIYVFFFSFFFCFALLCFAFFVFLFFYCLFVVCFNNLRCKKLYLRLNDNPLNPLSRKPTTFLSYFILFNCFFK